MRECPDFRVWTWVKITRKLHKLNGNYTDNLSNEKLLREIVLLHNNGWFRAFHIFCITFRRFTRTLNGASVKQIGANMAKSYWVFLYCCGASWDGVGWWVFVGQGGIACQTHSFIACQTETAPHSRPRALQRFSLAHSYVWAQSCLIRLPVLLSSFNWRSMSVRSDVLNQPKIKQIPIPKSISNSILCFDWFSIKFWSILMSKWNRILMKIKEIL